MSGGHYDYQDFRLNEIVEQMKRDIISNNIPDQDNFDYCPNFGQEIIESLKLLIPLIEDIREAIHHIDYLYSGDIGEKECLERIKPIIDEWNLKGEPRFYSKLPI